MPDRSIADPGWVTGCPRCRTHPATRIPVVGEDRRCTSCAIAYWTALVEAVRRPAPVALTIGQRPAA